MIRIGINGYGRIGRAIMRLICTHYAQDFHVVVINGSGTAQSWAHLTRYDSVYGTLPASVELIDPHHIAFNHRVASLSFSRESIDWRPYEVDVVLECTGSMKNRSSAAVHLQHGAPYVLVSSPCDLADKTLVYGINHTSVSNPKGGVYSSASCTTNALAPLLQVLHRNFTIERGFATTIHAYTNDQSLLDSSHRDLRRARAANQSMIPTTTGATDSIGLVIPDLAGKLQGYSMRVPVSHVSALNLDVQVSRPASIEAVNQAMKEASTQSDLSSVLAYNDEPLVSTDFTRHPASSIYDATQTQVLQSHQIHVLGWYDNEWAFAARMLDLVRYWASHCHARGAESIEK